MSQAEVYDLICKHPGIDTMQLKLILGVTNISEEVESLRRKHLIRRLKSKRRWQYWPSEKYYNRD